MNDLEREFIDASQVSAEREVAEREAQRERELEAAQKLAETEKARAEEQSRKPTTAPPGPLLGGRIGHGGHRSTWRRHRCQSQ